MLHLSKKIEELCDIEGYDSPEDMMEAFICDSMAPAICVSDNCDYSEMMEQDQDRGWCPECEANTLQSIFILAGII